MVYLIKTSLVEAAKFDKVFTVLYFIAKKNLIAVEEKFAGLKRMLKRKIL